MNYNEFYKNYSHDNMKQLQEMQKIFNSPAYQSIAKQQEILNKMSIPFTFNFKINENFYKLQELMTNKEFLVALANSQNFLNAANIFQNDYENFATEFNELNSDEQEKFNELVNNESEQKSILQNIKNTPEKTKKKFIKLKEKFTKLKDSAKNFFKNIIYPSAKKVLNTISDLKTILTILEDIKKIILKILIKLIFY